ncbi:hypothetical protein BRADI_4g15415v3 [Brachypodium distachyon]|uniref:Uncharacterized protein n=1 Tax=Brachypodium distachyon TaxID=15368 RepID=A0A0Q3HQA3_BRADI|nr:hypothetical protein BRADI_4g15415v3 [Brachypodium distachyon]
MENCIFCICNNAMGERRELNPRMDFSLFSIHHYSIYSDLHTSIEILDIDCRSLKRKKKE